MSDINGQLGLYNAQNAQSTAFNNDLFGLAGTVLSTFPWS